MNISEKSKAQLIVEIQATLISLSSKEKIIDFGEQVLTKESRKLFLDNIHGVCLLTTHKNKEDKIKRINKWNINDLEYLHEALFKYAKKNNCNKKNLL